MITNKKKQLGISKPSNSLLEAKIRNILMEEFNESILTSIILSLKKYKIPISTELNPINKSIPGYSINSYSFIIKNKNNKFTLSEITEILKPSAKLQKLSLKNTSKYKSNINATFSAKVDNYTLLDFDISVKSPNIILTIDVKTRIKDENVIDKDDYKQEVNKYMSSLRNKIMNNYKINKIKSFDTSFTSTYRYIPDSTNLLNLEFEFSFDMYDESYKQIASKISDHFNTIRKNMKQDISILEKYDVEIVEFDLTKKTNKGKLIYKYSVLIKNKLYNNEEETDLFNN